MEDEVERLKLEAKEAATDILENDREIIGDLLIRINSEPNFPKQMLDDIKALQIKEEQAKYLRRIKKAEGPTPTDASTCFNTVQFIAMIGGVALGFVSAFYDNFPTRIATAILGALSLLFGGYPIYRRPLLALIRFFRQRFARKVHPAQT
eukprot:TRINITY_DN4329_c0_g1_i1.p1 TRINITY_DN4329_c0_g1~~TRINITY_DN4329_c0_g1_i1.p1  ORF type:complete len:150 (-),score=28.65 TRINITY_DN4329_c0_g1_i1:76-525(-)